MARERGQGSNDPQSEKRVFSTSTPDSKRGKERDSRDQTYPVLVVVDKRSGCHYC
jgi:hypothetical protein